MASRNVKPMRWPHCCHNATQASWDAPGRKDTAARIRAPGATPPRCRTGGCRCERPGSPPRERAGGPLPSPGRWGRERLPGQAIGERAGARRAAERRIEERQRPAQAQHRQRTRQRMEAEVGTIPERENDDGRAKEGGRKHVLRRPAPQQANAEQACDGPTRQDGSQRQADQHGQGQADVSKHGIPSAIASARSRGAPSRSLSNTEPESISFWTNS